MKSDWRTGTSAESWRLRGLGRYREADEVLRNGVAEKDPEALMTLYWLNYPGGLCEKLFGKNRAIPLWRAMEAGHPVACVMLHELRNTDYAAVTKYAEESGCAAAIMEDCRCTGRRIPPSLADRIRQEGDPDTLFRLWETTGPSVMSALAFHLVSDLGHPQVAWEVTVPAISQVWRYYSTPSTYILASQEQLANANHGLGNAVRHIERAAAQGHIEACHQLALICFNGLVPAEFRDSRRGARLLTYVLLYKADVQKPAEDPSFVLLKERLLRFPAHFQEHCDRVYELYHYGKAWRMIPKGENMFPSAPHKRVTPFVKLGKASKTKDLGDHHPFHVYSKAKGSCKKAVTVFMGCMRKRRLSFRVPLDIIQMLGRVVWDARQDQAYEWFFMMGQASK